MPQTGSSGAFKVGSLLIGGVCISTFTGTIDTANTYKNTVKALPKSLLIDLTGGKLYINTNTKASPTWTVVGTQS
jgi:hypothetical protein